MKRIDNIGLKNVQTAYSGPEAQLWELIMGEQIHIGGLASSLDLADKAGIKEGSTGVDFCCYSGAGMRALINFRGVARMIGVDATEAAVELGQKRCRERGLSKQAEFVLADVCQSGLPDACANFVWGEDSWCYVVDKGALLREAIRLVRPGGTIAFTDWLEGNGLNSEEAERYLRFMKFPNIFSLEDYQTELERCGLTVVRAEDTGRFAPCAALYLEMLQTQATSDALRILAFDQAAANGLMGELTFVRDLAKTGKIIQGLFVAAKK